MASLRHLSLSDVREFRVEVINVDSRLVIFGVKWWKVTDGVRCHRVNLVWKMLGILSFLSVSLLGT